MLSNFLNFLLKNILLKAQNKRIIKYLPKELINIVDVGAHHGELYYTLIRNGYKFNNYVMFEPYKSAFNKINRIDDNRVKKFNLAISSVNSEKEFSLNPLTMTSSFSEVNSNLLKFKIKNILFNNRNKSNEKTLVSTETLDSYNFDHKGTNFLKVDTEGHELDVLMGAKSHLNSRTFEYILLEIQKPNTYKNYNPQDIFEFLSSNSYEVVKEFKVPFFGFSDILFIKK